MSERSLCERCRRPTVVCYCAHIEPVVTNTRVLFLQHPRERDVAINTARIARLCLPNSDLRVGVDFARDRVVRETLQDPARPAVLLFPSDEAVDLREHRPAGPVTLVVLDGTWSQAAKLLKLNPFLRALPQYRLAPSKPSDYRIRREPADHCVATIEAIAEVLGVLEGDPERVAPILKPFRAMVDRQLEYAARVNGARTRYRRAPAPPKPRPVPRALVDRANDVVLAYGEASAWPFDQHDAPAPEIIHWIALRPSTGEWFEARVAPSRPLAPSAPYHTGLSREEILAGEPRASFAERWSRFVRGTDLLVTWGSYACDVLADEGLSVPERLDLRAATALYLGARTGPLEACPERLGVDAREPRAAGRAGQRFAALEAVERALREYAERKGPVARSDCK